MTRNKSISSLYLYLLVEKKINEICEINENEKKYSIVFSN